MTEISYEDTQFVAETIGRETVERSHAILTGLVERGWTPPATGEHLAEREVCPYDCDSCHDDECPCPRLGCAGYGTEDTTP